MTARLMVADSEQDADMLYAVGMFVPDPFIYFEAGGRSHVVMSDLEVDRARHQATVDRVLPYRRYVRQLQRAGQASPRLADVLNRVLQEHRIRRVVVPGSFPVGLARRLRVPWRVVPGAFFPERERKSAAEVRHLRAALELAEAGMRAAVRAVRASRIGRDRYLYWRGQRLTSEHVRGLINATIAARGGCAQHTIVAGGHQGCDPHERGHGPLRAHEPIIVDIFPRDTRTGYWGDITRTVVRGRASEKVKQLYALVAQAQDVAFERLRAGVDGQTIHEAIQRLFRREGFPTGVKRGFQQGFFHGTGHGLGLEIHEAPRISGVKSILAAGHVVTVEPGLYYRGIGGVRLEDVVVITAKGCRNLTTFPKFLEI
jgi:Xaa-Pro aminopeptidase